MMVCISCGALATDQHHLIVTKAMARGVPRQKKAFWELVESKKNKWPLCNGCHINANGQLGHITRRGGLALLEKYLGHKAAHNLFEDVLVEAERHTKTKFARVV